MGNEGEDGDGDEAGEEKEELGGIAMDEQNNDDGEDHHGEGEEEEDGAACAVADEGRAGQRSGAEDIGGLVLLGILEDAEGEQGYEAEVGGGEGDAEAAGTEAAGTASLNEEEDGNDEYGSDAWVNAKFDVAVAEEISGDEEEGGAGDGIAEPPAKRGEFDEEIDPAAFVMLAGFFDGVFVKGLQADFVVLREFSESEGENEGGAEEGEESEQAGAEGRSTGERIIESGEPGGREESDPPGMRREGGDVVDLENKLGKNLSAEDGGDGDENLGGGHDAFEAFAAEPTEAELIDEDDATGAKECFEDGGDGVDDGELPTAVGGGDADEEADEVKSAGDPEGDFDEHADFRPEKCFGRDRAMEEDIGFFGVEEDFTGGGCDEHAEEDEGHGVEIDGESEDGLVDEGGCEEADEGVNGEGHGEFSADGFWGGFPADAAGAAAAEEEGEEEAAKGFLG